MQWCLKILRHRYMYPFSHLNIFPSDRSQLSQGEQVVEQTAEGHQHCKQHVLLDHTGLDLAQLLPKPLGHCSAKPVTDECVDHRYIKVLAEDAA